MRVGLIGILFVGCTSLSIPAVGQVTFADNAAFLQAVKNRDAGTAIDIISRHGSVALNARDRTNGEGALHAVVKRRDLTWLALLLGKGARPDLQTNRGETPLTLAAQMGWLEGVELLLAWRASVDLPNARGETPLILATQHRDVPVVRLLLSNGANPLRTESVAGLTALDYAKQDPKGHDVLMLLQQKRSR